MECYRQSWDLPHFNQFNAVHSNTGVLRGVHVHPTHADYLLVLSGKMLLGLHDIRRESATHRQSTILELSGEQPMCCFIPVGVVHGFYFPEPTFYVYGLSEEWNLEGDFGCRWDDPQLGLNWPVDGDPLLSRRDKNAPSYTEMVARYYRTVSQGKAQ